MTTTTEYARYWFVVVNTIVIIIASAVGIFCIQVHWYDLGCSSDDHMRTSCHIITAILFVALIVNGLLIWGIFGRNTALFWPWFVGSFAVVGFFTVCLIHAILLPAPCGITTISLKELYFRVNANYIYSAFSFIAVVSQYKAIQNVEKNPLTKDCLSIKVNPNTK